MQNRNLWTKIALGVALCEGAGALGIVWTIPALREWYPSLQKPEWTPPDAAFGPVWIALYALIGVAVGVVWAGGLDSNRERRAFGWFWSQLALSVAWSAAFFGLRSPAWGYTIIVGLWLAIAATIWLFSKISRLAGWLLMPYFLWVTFASMLNFSILGLNVIKPGVQKMDKDPRNGPTNLPNPDRTRPS